MIQKVYDLLKPLGLPLKFSNMPEFDTKGIVISYHFFGQGFDTFGDGQGIVEGGSLQIDLYSKNDYSMVVEQIKSTLTSAGFCYADGRDDVEELDANTSIYRKILIFNYSKGRLK